MTSEVKKFNIGALKIAHMKPDLKTQVEQIDYEPIQVAERLKKLLQTRFRMSVLPARARTSIKSFK
jgi:hypothetical protein